MELRHFRYFGAVAEQGSFSKAARTLYVSESAISEQVGDLERELGVTLFHRDGRSVALTAAGEVFLEETRTVLAAARHAVEMAQGAQRGEIGTLRVGFFAGGIGGNFIKIVRRFRRQRPGVPLSVAGMTPSAAWESVVLLVQAGEGISMLPSNHQQAKTSDLAFCPLTATNASIDLIIAWSPKRDSAILESFRKLVEAMKRS